MSDLRFSAAELLADAEDIVEPLVVGGVRCHGGFTADGTYRPPRTRVRVPAITAWQDRHRRTFGTEILEAPVSTWPAPYPSVAQTKYLLREGVRAPVVTQLTRIGTVEGFGAVIRMVGFEDMTPFFVESIEGTAVEHLTGGLFEAHARDEAGWEAEAGHRHMWFAARDVAFESPETEDETGRMLERMGIRRAGEPGPTRPPAETPRRFPDLDAELEQMIRRMISILFIEISAFHTFAWAEAVLSDPDLVAGDGEAAAVVRCIRADETPHVDYLRTALTEMRDRTFVGTSGRRIPGADVVGTLWDELLAESLGPRRIAVRETAVAELTEALAGHRRRGSILEEFHALAEVPAQP